MIRKILVGLLVALVVIQFIRPARNTGAAQTPTDITHVVAVPDSTMKLLQVACYDCHSNHTRYPWYAEVNPVGMWLNDHVNEGKRELNFSEFATYAAKRQAHKLGEIAEDIKTHDMPLGSYLWIHTDARLTDAQRQIIIRWADSAKARIPAQP
jgi:Haem-binding domain